jgi:hypothetical protein
MKLHVLDHSLQQTFYMTFTLKITTRKLAYFIT